MKQAIKRGFIILAAILFILICLHALFLDSGAIGAHAYYLMIKPTGTVFIFGRGETQAFNTSSLDAYYHIYSPFYFSPTTEQVKTVIVGNGITDLGAFLFTECTNLKAVYLPASIEEYPWTAFPSTIQELHFEGNCPDNLTDCRNASENPLHYANSLGLTVYYQPGTTGWDTPAWEGFQLIEQKYHVDWS